MSIPSQVGPQHSQKPKYHYKPYDILNLWSNLQLLLSSLGGSLGHKVMAVVVVLLTTVFPGYAWGGKNFK